MFSRCRCLNICSKLFRSSFAFSSATHIRERRLAVSGSIVIVNTKHLINNILIKIKFTKMVEKMPNFCISNKCNLAKTQLNLVLVLLYCTSIGRWSGEVSQIRITWSRRNIILLRHSKKQGGSVKCVCTWCSDPAHPHFRLGKISKIQVSFENNWCLKDCVQLKSFERIFKNPSLEVRGDLPLLGIRYKTNNKIK